MTVLVSAQFDHLLQSHVLTLLGREIRLLLVSMGDEGRVFVYRSSTILPRKVHSALSRAFFHCVRCNSFYWIFDADVWLAMRGV